MKRMILVILAAATLAACRPGYNPHMMATGLQLMTGTGQFARPMTNCTHQRVGHIVTTNCH